MFESIFETGIKRFIISIENYINCLRKFYKIGRILLIDNNIIPSNYPYFIISPIQYSKF